VLLLQPCGPSRLQQEVEAGDAPFDERHPGVVEEVLDVRLLAGGEVVDDHEIVVVG